MPDDFPTFTVLAIILGLVAMLAVTTICALIFDEPAGKAVAKPGTDAIGRDVDAIGHDLNPDLQGVAAMALCEAAISPAPAPWLHVLS
jgi:hypothetical protein